MSEKRIYRTHSDEFKAEAVRMVLEQHAKRTEVARNLGIALSLLEKWIKKAQGSDTKRQTGESEQIRALERALKKAEMERDILKKAVAFFAKESP